MPFSAVLLSGATLGMTTLAFAIATPASAQYVHSHYMHAHHYHHYGHFATTTRVVRSSSMHKSRWSCRARSTPPGDPWRRSAPSWVEPARPWGTLHRRRRGCGQFRGRSAWRHGGALRLPADLRLWRSVRCAVQCGRDSGRSAVPMGGRRFRRAAGRACPRRLLSSKRTFITPHLRPRSTARLNR